MLWAKTMLGRYLVLSVAIVAGCSSTAEAPVRGVMFSQPFNGRAAYASHDRFGDQIVQIVEDEVGCKTNWYAPGKRYIEWIFSPRDGYTARFSARFGKVDAEGHTHWQDMTSNTFTVVTAATVSRDVNPESPARFGRIRLDATAVNGDSVSGEITYEWCY
jgi:hypothetical protein